MSKRVGVIGYPIKHSISPVFQQAALDHYSLDATYQRWEVEPQALPGFIETLRSPDTWGVNVTVPHKEAVMPHLDHIDDWARTVGAVNTIFNENGRLSGYNTDSSGFLRALEGCGRFSPEGRSVLIIGAGGSAKGVALALASRGAGAITIANRSLRRAQSLAELVRSHGSLGPAQDAPRTETLPLAGPTDDLARAVAGCDLLVNCTTLGMRHGPDENGSLVPAEYIPSHVLVYDLVYNPPETPLLREAARAGAAVLGGLPMLVYQGAASFELWTGNEAPVEVMLKAAREALP